MIKKSSFSFYFSGQWFTLYLAALCLHFVCTLSALFMLFYNLPSLTPLTLPYPPLSLTPHLSLSPYPKPLPLTPPLPQNMRQHPCPKGWGGGLGKESHYEGGGNTPLDSNYWRREATPLTLPSCRISYLG